MLVSTIFVFGSTQVSSDGSMATIVLNCGSLLVQGSGGDAAVYAQANDNIDVEIDPSGELVKFKVGYAMNNIDGLMDCAWCRIYHNGFIRDSAQCDTGSCNGILSFQLFCYPSDQVSILLESEYADLIGVPGFEWHIYAHDTSVNSFTFTAPENNPPNQPSKPNGPTDMKIGHGIFYPSSQTCPYSSSTTDPDGNQLYYTFTYDGGWIGPYPSGSTCTTYITWDTPGTFEVKCQAKDVPEYDCQDVKYSDWSRPLWVHVKYWYGDNAAYSEALLVNISVEIFESGFEPFLNDPHPELNTSQLAYEGFFADTDNDSYYDVVYIFALIDGENVITQLHEYPVFYDARSDTYIVDFNENNQADAEETSSPVPAESISLCTDGNPYA